MANNCMTDVTILGPENQIEKLYSVMEKLNREKKPSDGWSYGSTWLGNIISALGGNPDVIYCRGYFFELARRDNNSLEFSCDSAWSEPHEFFDFLRDVLPEIDIYFYAEEGGCDYYVTNDATGCFYSQRFIVMDEEIETVYLDTEEQLLDCARKWWGLDCEDFGKLANEVADSETRNVIRIEVV